ncbi:hypothetical protein GIB67_016696 [Kingdonia uniflora]|uniref:Peptidase S54 rhomboid domain-containing protein n=1 Tax=Kingdonia uniflora TaxID=39325 RepID=A0A7J7LM70_9MAGN|nr:hypothetical protein GIB67_016696 [Kingdonia uniflora]
MPLCFCSVSGDSKLHLLNHTSFPNKRKIKHKAKGVEKDTPHLFLCASKSINNGRQLKTLDSYFSKLKKETTLVPSRDSEPKIMGPPSKSLDETMKLVDGVGQFKTRKAMSSLEDYLGKLKAEDKISEENPTRTLYSDNGDHGKSVQKSMTSYTQLGSKDVELGLENTEGLQSSYESSDAYLVSMLASINIAVFLFEIASPVRNSGIEILSLPSLYGAKINELILVGEWWRLVTPMFLHSGVLHVSLSCWVLLTFGPQVCKGYGSWTFFLIYLLGGISGNMTSFIHTSETTVGGTGPVFAIIGAWLIYQIQNKGVIAKKVSESLFQKAVIATALSFVLSTFGLIDDW